MSNEEVAELRGRYDAATDEKLKAQYLLELYESFKDHPAYAQDASLREKLDTAAAAYRQQSSTERADEIINLMSDGHHAMVARALELQEPDYRTMMLCLSFSGLPNAAQTYMLMRNLISKERREGRFNPEEWGMHPLPGLYRPDGLNEAE